MIEKLLDLVQVLVSKNIIKDVKPLLLLPLIFLPKLLPGFELYVMILIIIISPMLYKNKVDSVVSKNDIKDAIKDHEKEQEEKHSELVNYRRNISKDIDSLLTSLGKKTNADRVFWAEYSNSTIGFTGIPFIYFSIHNEYTRNGISPINVYFQKQNISSFKFLDDVYQNRLHIINDIEDIKDTDPMTYIMLKDKGFKKGYFLSGDLGYKRIGFCAITYNSLDKIDDMKLILELTSTTNTILDMLNIQSK